MTISRSDDLLVGLIGLGLLTLIAMRIARGLRDGRLPLYRTYVRREDDAGKFNAVLGIHGLSLVLVAVMTADLLLGLGIREKI